MKACGQAIRIKRIFSTEENLIISLEKLKQWLITQGYKEDQAESEVKRVHSIERSSLLKKRKKHTDNHITLVLTYQPALNQVFEILG